MRKFLAVGSLAFCSVFGASSASAGIIQVRQAYLSPTSTGNASGGSVGGELENIDEAEALLAGAAGFTQLGSNFTDSPTHIDYAGTTFPGSGGLSGNSTNNFALEAVAQTTLTTGTTGTFTFYINSDEGFRLRKNGNVIGEFFGQTTASSTTLTNVTVSNGDVFRLTYFEHTGSEFITWRINNSSGALVGDTASGILLSPVPEPTSAALLALGAAGALLRRRRAK